MNIAGEWAAEWEKHRRATKLGYQNFAKAQLQVYEQASFGWPYWTLKNVHKHWSLEWMIDNGYISLESVPAMRFLLRLWIRFGQQSYRSTETVLLFCFPHPLVGCFSLFMELLHPSWVISLGNFMDFHLCSFPLVSAAHSLGYLSPLPRLAKFPNCIMGFVCSMCYLSLCYFSLKSLHLGVYVIVVLSRIW